MRAIIVAAIVGCALISSAASTPDQRTCVASGGQWDASTHTCVTGAGTGGTPQPLEGTTINCAPPSASGDPLKGLNVSKGGTNKGGELCP